MKCSLLNYLAASALLICGHQNLALSQVLTTAEEPTLVTRDERGGVEIIYEGTLPLSVIMGPNVSGGEFMYRKEKQTIRQTIGQMIKIIDASPKYFEEWIKQLGGRPDIERLRQSLRNIKFAPMNIVVAKNSSKFQEKKQLDYNIETNSIIALKPFFENFKELTETGPSWNNFYLNMMKSLIHEASHSQGLGLTAELDEPQSTAFENAFFRVSIEFFKKNETWCGISSSLEMRAQDCAWITSGFVDYSISHTSRPRNVTQFTSYRYQPIQFDPSMNQIFSVFANDGMVESEKPVKSKVLERCEEMKRLAFPNKNVRLATHAEAMARFPETSDKNVLFMVSDSDDYLNYQGTPVTPDWLKIHWFTGSRHGGAFSITSICLFE